MVLVLLFLFVYSLVSLFIYVPLSNENRLSIFISEYPRKSPM